MLTGFPPGTVRNRLTEAFSGLWHCYCVLYGETDSAIRASDRGRNRGQHPLPDLIMPEGPSIVILKEQAEAFEGRRVLAVSGNSKEDIQRMKDQQITEFRTWGKHFLICFGDFTVRIHLMLFGSYRVNEERPAVPRVSLSFDNGYLNFYNCSVKIIEGNAGDLYDWTADIMSDLWDEENAEKKLRIRPEALLCDVLLDQHIFAGSGNIIKNEVLYRVRLHPLNSVGQLPPEKLTWLIKETRNYAFDFLRWKKEYTLRKHWLVHTKVVCPSCNLPLSKGYLGKTKRRTFYCSNCQELYDKAGSYEKQEE